MIAVLSPSKSMTTTSAHMANSTRPAYLDKTSDLIKILRQYSTTDLTDFMGISESLAKLNQQRFKDWALPFTTSNAKEAIYAFTGDVYDGLDASTLAPKDITFAQNHLRILSGLYGLLRPLDLIQAYRLEMGRPLKTKHAKNLYGYWQATVTRGLNDMPGKILINLASQEYFKAIDPHMLNKSIVSPIFKDEKNGAYKIISFYAKKARGSMARYILTNKISDETALLSFSEDGYVYNPKLSSETIPVFTRKEQQPK